VWIYDTTTGKKVDEIHLKHPARSLHVDQGSPSYLYALSSHHGTLQILDAKTGAHKGHLAELGHEPNLIIGATQ
jgi:hypothetical protein